MANEFIARNGLISQNNSVVTGSLTVTQGITGSLFGTASLAQNAISASQIQITDNNTTNATFYPILSPSSSGAVGARVDVSTLSYNPSTNTLSTGDLLLSQLGDRTLTLQPTTFGGTEIKLLPNSTSGYARINVGNTLQPLDFQMNSVDVMRIAQDGKIGIGTTGATAKLEVRGTGNTAATTTLLVQNSSLTSLLSVRDDGSTTLSGSLIVTQGISGSFSGSGANLFGIPASGIAGLNLSQITTGSVTASVSTGTGSFQITSGSTSLLFISSSGNVGIGTTTPTVKFDIVDSNNIPTFKISNPGGGGFGGGGNIDIVGGASDYVEGQISWKNGATTRAFIGYPSFTRTMTLSSEQIIDFQTSGGSKMYLDSSGNLGIGKTPTTKLDVSGSVNITGSLNVTQGITGSLQGTASYASNGGVTSIIAGTNITISSATGNVTINSTGGGGGGGTDLGLVQAMTVGLQNIF